MPPLKLVKRTLKLNKSNGGAKRRTTNSLIAREVILCQTYCQTYGLILNACSNCSSEKEVTRFNVKGSRLIVFAYAAVR